MAALSSRLFRTLIRRGRLYSDKPVVQANVKKAYKSGHPQEIAEAYEADNAQWRFFCFFGVLPSVALAYYNAYWVVEEDHHGPEFEEIPGMRVRRKPFPWGDGNHSLFHNPAMNALPEGYEEVEGH